MISFRFNAKNLAMPKNPAAKKKSRRTRITLTRVKEAEQLYSIRSTNSSPNRNCATSDKRCFIDLFAGCGGLSLGLEQAGFRPLLFSEINRSAAETYLANRSACGIIPVGDIYHLTDDNLRLLKLSWYYDGVPDVDLVCGGPPCQGYSGIGYRRSFKIEKKDIPSNHLYQEMVRVIRRVRPRIFLFENVRGLLASRWSAAGRNGEVFKGVLTEFKQLTDYCVRWDVLHAKDYGVPQNRR
jgi:DNA (cytosine-5)-methyltransferase 1